MVSSTYFFFSQPRSLLVDKTDIGFTGNFYSLKKKTVKCLLSKFYEEVDSLFGENCVSQWLIQSRKSPMRYVALKDLEKELGERSPQEYSLIFHGFFKNNIVFDNKSMRMATKRYYAEVTGDYSSTDWQEYYDTNLGKKKRNAKEFKAELLRLFNMENHVLMESCGMGDFGAGFSCYKTPWPDLFLGYFRVSISRYCLETQVDDWAEKLCHVCKKLAEGFRNVNLCVYSNSSLFFNDAYSSYYGEFPDIEMGRAYQSFLKNYYIPDVGWGHFVSENTRRLIANQTGAQDDLTIEELNNGGCFIRSKAPLSVAGINDLKKIKAYLYSAILPRTKTFRIDAPFRNRWEQVPVFDNEITVTEETVTFQHFGKIDTSLICGGPIL